MQKQLQRVQSSEFTGPRRIMVKSFLVKLSENNTQEVSSDRARLMKAQLQATKANNKWNLLRMMLRKQVGVSEVERAAIKLGKSVEICDSELVKMLMRKKVASATRAYKEREAYKKNISRDLSSKYKMTLPTFRKIKKIITEKVEKIKKNQKAKNMKKIEHLERKYVRKKEDNIYKLPEELSDFKNVKIFKEKYSQEESKKKEINLA